MKSNTLPPKEKLPELAPEDQEFAERITSEFDLPLDEISWFVRSFRYALHTNNFGAVSLGFNAKNIFLFYSEMLFGPDVVIQEISFTTNSGITKIKSSDPLFRYFGPPLIKIKKELEKEMKLQEKDLDWFKKKEPLYCAFYFFHENTSLNKFKTLYAVGMFMVHFRLYGYKPILEEHEFTDDYGAYDYKHYLVDIVKRRLKNFLSQEYL